MGSVKKPRDIKGALPASGLGRKLDPLWDAVANRPTAFILLILILTAVSFIGIVQLKIDPDLEAMSVENSPEKIAYRKFIDQYGSDEFIVVAAKVNHGDLFTTKNLTTIKTLSDELAKLDLVDQVYSLSMTPVISPDAEGITIAPLYDEAPTDPAALAGIREKALTNPMFLHSIVSADGKTAVWFAFPDLQKGDNTDLRITMFEQVNDLALKHLDGFEVHLEGIPTVKSYMVKYIKRAVLLFGLGSALLLSLVLFLTFRSLRAVFLPGMVVTMALCWTLGIMGMTGGVLDSISSLIFSLIAVVGVGDTIHVLVHNWEEYFTHNDKRKAVVLTMRRMFAPCLLTSVTTAVGFLSLATIRIPPIRTFGMYAGVGVLSAFLISIIFVPAVLMLLSPPANLHRKKYDTGLVRSSLVGLGRFNQRFPRAIVMVAAVLVIFSLVGISRIKVETRVSEFFHPWSPIVQGYKFLEENVTPPVPLEIFFEGEPDLFKDPKSWQWVEALQKDILKIPLVKRSESYLDVLKELQWALNGGDSVGAKRTIPASREAIAQLSLLFQMDDPETFERFMGHNFDKAHITLRMLDSSSAEQDVVIRQIWSLIDKHVPKNVNSDIAGGTAIFVSTVRELTKGQIRSLTLALIVITLLIALIFRSVKIGLLSMIPNVLPILMMLGLMGWAGFPLDTNTVMVGPITLGIAVDDTIHYITRYRRELSAGHSSAESMVRTLTSTGRALMSTSMILSCGFLLTVFSSFRPQSILGGLGAVTIMLALAADLILLPAVMLSFFKKDD
jgi:hypothetical protein